ncbi:FEKKY domain-containing protein [Mucilaginibacter sp. KACC 22063]|uniref:FEKKY domain-containing protein n=1 Tax=Mucilaginibacter sp. KACC 22063 TaxID=3025666 RepID=UPI00236703AD|nr:hypothetical protein [Mucilaginibacter sp. KACC 22063]WDF57382.1 hypothetical protein PQ461_09975 [Mucilaginibacter sp. KACC 22063]
MKTQILFALSVLLLLISCKENKKHAANLKATIIDTSLKWIDYRIGERPPEGYFTAFDSIIKKWNIRYQRIEGGCTALPAQRQMYEKDNPKYFKILQQRFGKDWYTRFQRQVKELDSALHKQSTDDCPRGAAVPVIKKAVFPNVHFALQSDHNTGIETLTLANGDKLTLKQFGCEYYNLSFFFETAQFAADTTDIAYWGNASLSLLRQVRKGLDTPLDIDTALNRLAAHIEKDKLKSGKGLEMGEEIDFGGPDPRQYLTIDQVSQLANKRYMIKITFSYGPI